MAEPGALIVAEPLQVLVPAGVRARLRALRGQAPGFLPAAAIVLAHALVAITGPYWAPHDPTQLLAGPPFQGPSWRHPLGTDNFGRDVLSRLVAGERLVLTLALSSAGLAVVLGSLIGMVSAYLGGWVDAVITRVLDIVLALPPLILALLVLSALGSGYPVVVGVVAFFFTARVASVIRGAALDVVTEDFITVARLRGESAWSIALRELLPNVLPAVFVELSIRTGYAILFIAGMSFLGFGASPPTPDWGLMINEGRSYIATAPWPVLAPSLALASLVVGLSLFTEGLSVALGLSARRAPNE
jgi:peptide/nickel transport system permease protein